MECEIVYNTIFDITVIQPKGFIHKKHPQKVCHLKVALWD